MNTPQNTPLSYAGIGSRKTPDSILNIMRHLASYLYVQGWTLRSGGAFGADHAFEQGVDDMNLARSQLGETIEDSQKQIYLPWRNFNHSVSELHPGKWPFTPTEEAIAKKFHPAWHRLSSSAKLMMLRNVRQLVGLNVTDGFSGFVVCWTPGGAVIGGTGQTLRMAQALNIPVINLGTADDNAGLEDLINQVNAIQHQVKQARAAQPEPGTEPGTEPEGEGIHEPG